MSERRRKRLERMVEKRELWIALGIFLLTGMIGIVCNKFAMASGYEGLRFGTTISRYVGAAPWTAMLFLIGNCFVSGLIAKHLWKVGEKWKMPRAFYYLIFAMAVGLILLSVFPAGYFDAMGMKSIITLAHELASRVMFISMLLLTGMLLGSGKGTLASKIACMIYAFYGAFCVAGFVAKAAWFLHWVLIFETAFIAGFIVVLLICERKVI